MAESHRLDRDIDFVLITGAGACCEFGNRDTKLPLMNEWSDALVEKLFKKEASYLMARGSSKHLGTSCALYRLFQRLNRTLSRVELSNRLAVSTMKPLSRSGTPRQPFIYRKSSNCSTNRMSHLIVIASIMAALPEPMRRCLTSWESREHDVWSMPPPTTTQFVNTHWINLAGSQIGECHTTVNLTVEGNP